jgi:hypothetical protein
MHIRSRLSFGVILAHWIVPLCVSTAVPTTSSSQSVSACFANPAACAPAPSNAPASRPAPGAPTSQGTAPSSGTNAPPRTASPAADSAIEETDFIVFANVGSRSSNVAVGLSGRLIFSGRAPTACRVGGSAFGALAQDAFEDWLREFNASFAQINIRDCVNAFRPDGEDLVLITARNLASQPALARSIEQALQRRDLVEAFRYSADQAREVRNAIRRSAEENTVRLAEGRSSGIVAILLDNRSSVACGMNIAEAELNFIIQSHARIISAELNERINFTPRISDPDSAFIAARRSNCRLVAGPVADMAIFRAALQRERMDSRVSSIFEPRQAAASRVPIPSSGTSVSNAPGNGAPPAATPRVTEATRPLISGSGNDILMILNVGPSAPHASLNVRGEPVFLNSRADMCVVGSRLNDWGAIIQLDSVLLPYGINLQAETLPSCAGAPLSSRDGYIARRSELLALPRTTLEGLLAGLEQRIAVIQETLLGSELEAGRDARRARSLANENRASSPNAAGFGYITVAGEGGLLCAVANDEFPVEQMVESIRTTLTAELSLRAPRAIQRTSEDAAYVAARRGTCRILMADAPTLSRFIAALRRDRISYQLSAAWHPDEEVARVAQQIRDQRAEQARARQISREEAEAQRVAQNERQRRAAEEAGTRTAQLRRINGPRAAALLNQLRTYVDASIQTSSGSATRNAPQIFVSFTEQYRRQIDGGWELDSADYLIHEFGESLSNDRILETIFVQMNFRMRHRDLGRYETHCFVVGYQHDAEFGRLRNSFDQRCESAPSHLSEWMSARRYQSLWTSSPQ